MKVNYKMWTILKFDKNNINFLKKELKDKLGNNVKFYIPKIKIKKFIKNKIFFKEISLLGDYLFFFHEDLAKKNVIESLKYCKGLKYFLSEFLSSQNEINQFIQKCKTNENDKGYLMPTFFEFNKNCNYQFLSGPFSNFVLENLNEKKLSISGMIGNFKIIASKKKNIFRAV